jgi:hypothetical protein
VSIDDEILACEGQLREAQLTGDVAVLDRLLDDLLLFTNLDGTLASKNDDLSLHRSGRLRIVRMDPSDRHLLHLRETSVPHASLYGRPRYMPMRSTLRTRISCTLTLSPPSRSLAASINWRAATFKSALV